MLFLIVALIVLGIFSAILGWLSHNKKGESSVILADSSSCSTCNGDDPKCEQLCMMEAATREIEYFDDEAEEFRNVMLTMQQNEVSAWSRSLTLRGIEVPYQVKDELLMLMEH